MRRSILVRLKGFEKLTSVDEALKTLLSMLDPQKPETETVSIDNALNRILAESVIISENVPRFDRSAVDGYAIEARDTTGASQSKPRILELITGKSVRHHECKQIWTGNPLPRGANAVAMLEMTKKLDDKIEIWKSVAPNENVSKKGEDLKRGETGLKKGTRLAPQHIGLLAVLGMAQVNVFRRPKIALLTTGNEVVPVGTNLEDSQIYDTNSHTLAAMCAELGAEPVSLGTAKDDVNEIAERISSGLIQSQIVITTGGTSVGALDLVPETVNRIGKPGVIIHGIAMRPAMPTALAIIDKKPVLIFSGNPAAAMIAFEVFARPVVDRLIGKESVEPRQRLKARLLKKVTTALGRQTYVRVRVFEKDGDFHAEPISTRGSGVISTMTRSNGYVIVPENREGLNEEEMVIVHLFGPVEAA